MAQTKKDNSHREKQMGYRDPFVVANYMIDKHDGDMMPMQLIKLVYIAHGWFLASCGIPLLRERVQAWKYGPVVPSIYYAVKGQDVVKSLPGAVNWDILHEHERDILDKTLEFYGDFTGTELSGLTHQRGTPWEKTWDGTFSKEIPNELIRDYYLELSEDADSDDDSE